MIISLFLLTMGICFIFLIFALGVLHFLGIFNKQAYQQALKLEIFIKTLPVLIKTFIIFIINLPKRLKRVLIFKKRLMVNRKIFHQFMKNHEI
jgi:hypothetical protein